MCANGRSCTFFLKLFFVAALWSGVGVFLAVILLSPVYPATAGVIGASFRRTPTDSAIQRTFSGESVGNDRRMQSKRGKWADNNHHINDEKYISRYATR
jgi:hypothetical protein